MKQTSYDGGTYVRTMVEDRAIMLGEYIVEKNATVRQAAAVFDVSKSTVHKDVTERLQKLDRRLYAQVKAVLEVNKAQRHIRGGAATRQKYLKNAHTDAEK